ncbi:MAG: phosphotransferase [Thermotogota bacterium]
MDLIGIGRTAEIYDYSENKIVKLFFENYNENVEKEFKINQLIQNQINNTAKVYEITKNNDRLGIVFDKINGKSLLKIMFENPAYIEKNMDIFFKNQKKINDIEIKNGLERYEDEIVELIKRNDFLDKEIINYILKIVHNTEKNNNLCHGDYHPDNLLIQDSEVYVIDWINARIGNPIMDMARTFILLKFGSLPEEQDENTLKKIEVLRKNIVNKYIEMIEKDKDNIEDFYKWTLVMAATRTSENIPVKEKNILKEYIIKHK